MRSRLMLAPILVLCALASVTCSGKPGRAAEYPEGTPISTIVSELGAPSYDEPYSRDDELHRAVCPSETSRVARYDGVHLPFQMHTPVTFLCVDKTNRVIKASFLDR